MKLIYASKNKNTEKFRDWATKLVYTFHLGTLE